MDAITGQLDAGGPESLPGRAQLPGRPDPEPGDRLQNGTDVCERSAPV